VDFQPQEARQQADLLLEEYYSPVLPLEVLQDLLTLHPL